MSYLIRLAVIIITLTISQECDYSEYGRYKVNDLYIFETELNSSCFELVEKKILEDASGDREISKEIIVARERSINKLSDPTEENSLVSNEYTSLETEHKTSTIQTPDQELTANNLSETVISGQRVVSDKSNGQEVKTSSQHLQAASSIMPGITFEENVVKIAVKDLGNYTASWQTGSIIIKGEGVPMAKDGIYLSPTFSKPLKHVYIKSEKNRRNGSRTRARSEQFEIRAVLDNESTRVESDKDCINFVVD